MESFNSVGELFFKLSTTARLTNPQLPTAPQFFVKSFETKLVRKMPKLQRGLLQKPQS